MRIKTNKLVYFNAVAFTLSLSNSYFFLFYNFALFLYNNKQISFNVYISEILRTESIKVLFTTVNY